MTTDARIDPIAAPPTPLGNDPSTTAAAPPDSASFRRLLESLEKLAREHRTVPPVADTEQMQAAIRRADDGFTTAMDLRQRLEAAFRGRLP